MSIRSEARGFRATLAVWIATVCTAAAALLAAAAQSASAYQPCPSGGNTAAGIINWNTQWPTPGADPKGVTLCHGFGSVLSKGYLQIVDLNDGAKLRLVSSIGDPPDKYRGNQQYFKETADAWYSSIRAGTHVSSPAPSRLFSTTNASYFNNTDLSAWTSLPFAHRFNGVHETWGTVMYNEWLAGYTFRCNSDGTGTASSPDVCALKRALRIGSPDTGMIQRITTYTNPFGSSNFGFYDAGSAEALLSDGGQALDGTIGFAPTWQVGAPGDTNRRNYIGFYGNVVYLFTSDASYTSAQANSIMMEINPNMTVIQLDGGGSAQFHSAYGSMDSSIPSFDREVPDVLAIYRAP